MFRCHHGDPDARGAHRAELTSSENRVGKGSSARPVGVIDTAQRHAMRNTIGYGLIFFVDHLAVEAHLCRYSRWGRRVQ